MRGDICIRPSLRAGCDRVFEYFLELHRVLESSGGGEANWRGILHRHRTQTVTDGAEAEFAQQGLQARQTLIEIVVVAKTRQQAGTGNAWLIGVDLPRMQIKNCRRGAAAGGAPKQFAR